MSILKNISFVEQKWQESLYTCIENIFKTTWLPSHDQWHSVRVWEFAKNLLLALGKNGLSITLRETEELMIASYFHDSGMSLTLNPEHGKHSRKLCHTFLKDINSMTPDQKKRILDAVEFHDDKSYRKEVFRNGGKLLPLLCIADDMDAFGTIGIYRFWEIHTLRKVQEDQMPEKIIQSLKLRMDFFSSVYPYQDNFYNSQLKRNKYTAGFYKQLKKEIKESKDTNTLSGTRQILSFFRNLILIRKNRPENLYTMVQNESRDPKVIDFFRKFNREVRFTDL